MLAKWNLWIVTILLNLFHQNNAVLDLITDSVKLRCYRGSVDKWTEVNITTPDQLITASDPCIDLEKPTVFSVNGFQNNVTDGDAVVTTISALLARGTDNVVLLNWEKDSYGIGLGPVGYPSAQTNSKIIAEQLANATIRLIQLGMSKNVHYVGHSLGAQLVGQAGRYAKKLNYTVTMITALDPARLFFSPIPTVYPTVGSDCGAFVVIAHCDPGGYAVDEATGHVDVYFNYGLYKNGTRRQLGCERGYTANEIFSNGNSCSHNRCWAYYSAALADPTLFKVGGATTYEESRQRNGSFTSVTYFGPEINTQARGNYYCRTSATSPWGLRDAGLYEL